jgi:hypothetical protein
VVVAVAEVLLLLYLAVREVLVEVELAEVQQHRGLQILAVVVEVVVTEQITAVLEVQVS